MVAGDHDRPDAAMLRLRNRIADFIARRVDHAAQADKRQMILNILTVQILRNRIPAPHRDRQYPQRVFRHRLVGFLGRLW